MNYADQTLRANVVAGREGRTMLVARGTVPINLALEGVTGSRIPHDRLIDATIDADSLPLDSIPTLSAAITNLKGRALANPAVGNRRSPRRQWPGHRVEWKRPPRATRRDGKLHRWQHQTRARHRDRRLARGAQQRRGVEQLSGGIGIAKLTEPSFALKLTANDARVIDNDNGNLFVDANVSVNGPFKNVDLTGSVHVLRGVLYIPEPTGKTLVGAGDPALYAVADTTNASVRELFPSQSPLLRQHARECRAGGEQGRVRTLKE